MLPIATALPGLTTLHRRVHRVGGMLRYQYSNWAQFRRPLSGDISQHGPWEHSGHGIFQGSAPDHWQGNFDFEHQSLTGAVQVFLGDATQPTNRNLAGFRSTFDPRHWLNVKYLGGSAAQTEVLPGHRAIWRDLYPQTDLGWALRNNGIRDGLRCKAPGHPLAFRFAVRVPIGYSVERQANTLVIFDPEGAVVLRTRPTEALDAAENPIGCTLADAPPITVGERTIRTFVKLLDADDCAGATYPIAAAPPFILDGAGDIEDNQMRSAGPTLNYGGTPSQYGVGIAGVDVRRGLFRLTTGSLPPGSPAAMRFPFTQYSNGFSTASDDLRVYSIKAANDWIEGTQNGNAQAGSSCHSFAKNNTQAWAGSAGCGTSGTDYDATAIGTMAFTPYTVGGTKPMTLTFSDPSIVAAWRDGGHANEGMLYKTLTEAAGSWMVYGNTSEAGAGRWTFEIDIAEIKKGFHFFGGRRR